MAHPANDIAIAKTASCVFMGIPLGFAPSLIAGISLRNWMGRIHTLAASAAPEGLFARMG
jgi:hypothetical protein